MKKILVQNTALSTKPVKNTDDPHTTMARLFKNELNSKPLQTNLTSVPIHQATRKTRVALAVLPMWGPQIAPYGIARLAGLSRFAGFETKCWDVNIQCYAKQKDLWNWLNDWKWDNEKLYNKDIYPNILKILENFLSELVTFKPDVLGFTVYYTNTRTTKIIIKKIRELLPNIKIIIGGPHARTLTVDSEESALVDYIVSGEGELIFTDFLENFENNILPTQQFLIHDKNVRIDLDSLPISDYRDFDISLYEFEGITSEFSRGCIAKCTFCSETTFWRYRGRVSNNVLNELEYNYKTFGIKTVWFIDSLINGNLKELKKFAQGLIDKNIQIRWVAFARNDKRMDKEYLQLLQKSGCAFLQIGVESGSPHVIKLIDKKVKIEDIEQNFNDMADIGWIGATTSWFVGFPGEMLVDCAHSLTLVWRLRNSGVDSKGFGMCQLNPDAPLGLEKDRFNICHNQGAFGAWWITNDWKNTIAHRVMRYKFTYMLLNHYRMCKVRPEHLGKRGEETGFLSHYSLTYDIENWIDDIPYEPDFDFYIIKPNINPVADSLVNEIWPLLRVLWLAMGSFKLDVKFDPEIDRPVYGDFKYFAQGFGGMWADYKFEINDNGHWIADFYTKLEAPHCNDGKTTFNFDFEHTWTKNGYWDRPNNS